MTSSRRLELNNFTLVTSGIVTDSSQVSEHIQRLKQYDARIIVGAFRSTKAPFIFCEAYKQGLYGEKFVWILPRSSMYDNWIDNADPNSYPCTREELIKATKGYITINHKRLSESTDVTFSGRTPQEYNELVNNMADASPYLLSRSHPLGYDTAYTLALTLNKTEQRLQEMNRSLTMFDYNDGITLEVMKSAIENVSFEGVSGPVAYTEDGRRVGIAYIEYNNYNVTTAMASYDPRDDSITWFQDSKQLFEGRPAPQDRFIYQEINEPYSRTAFISVLFLDTVGVVIGIFFFAFNVKYRKNRHIKMSSPHINNFIILGCLVMYLAVYFNTLDYGQYFDSTLRNSICMIKLWTSLLGFTLAFGALFSKTWRVHVLFRHSAMKKRSIKDYQLFGMLLVLTLVDLVILIPWTIFHPLQKEEIKFQSEDLSNSDTVVTVIYTECRHPFDIYWYASEYIYKGLLLVFGVFLAWENRMVSVPALNDSKLIGFCVYNVVVVCAFGVPIGHVLAVQQSTLLFILSSIFTTFCTTLVLCILFIPKFRLRHKTGDLRFVNSLNENLKTQSTLSNVNNTPQTQPAWTVQNEDTHHEVAVLKKKLVDEKNAINRLKMDIEKITNNEVNVHKVDGEYIVVKTVSDNSSV